MNESELELQPHECQPLALRFAALGIHPHDSEKIVVSLYIDASNRPDVFKILEAHQKGLEGDIQTSWASIPDQDSNGLYLILEFIQPIQSYVLIGFEPSKHGILIDSLTNGAILHLVPVTSETKFEEFEEGQSQGLYIDGISDGLEPHWKDLWTDSLVGTFGISADEAKRFIDIELLEVEIRRRDPDFPPFDNIAGIRLDEQNKRRVIFTKDALINHLKRDSPKVAESFDNHFGALTNVLSAEFSRVLFDIVPSTAQTTYEDDDLRHTCGQLIGNAYQSLVAALELTRLGYRLQPGTLLRNATETIATALYLFKNPNQLKAYYEGNIRSTSTLNEAKEIVPHIGHLWGLLTNGFAHVSNLYHRIQLPEEYESPDDPAAKTNLLGLYLSFSVLEMASELIFFDSFGQHHYWKRVNPNEYQIDISDRLEKLQDYFSQALAVDIDDQEDTDSQ